MFLGSVEFEQYESEHFVFYFIKGSRVEKDIEEISVKSEFAVSYAEKFMQIKNDMKIDGYFFDTNDEAFSNQNFVAENMNSSGTKTGFKIMYEDCDYRTSSASSLILHEATHLIHSYMLGLKNSSISEGYAFYTADI
jgi:hypothetical protein